MAVGSLATLSKITEFVLYDFKVLFFDCIFLDAYFILNKADRLKSSSYGLSRTADDSWITIGYYDGSCFDFTQSF